MSSETMILIDDVERVRAQGAIGTKLYSIFTKVHFGDVHIGRTRVTSQAIGLSMEPDIVTILPDTLLHKKVTFRLGPGRGEKPFLEVEGCPDLVVEIITKNSERLLPGDYAMVGIPEVWVADLRRDSSLLTIYNFREGSYEPAPVHREDWTTSPLLGMHFRLVRKKSPLFDWTYRIEHKRIERPRSSPPPALDRI